MKRFTALICTLFLLVSLCACQASDIPKETDVPKETTLETTTPQETTTPWETTVPQISADEVSDPMLPEGFPMEFIFSSGAGAWYTSLTLNPDGSFTGTFHDSEMGAISDEHPNGVVYISVFSGVFENIRKVNDYTYTITLSTLGTQKREGETWIEDGIHYIASAPYGLTGGTEFRLYLPQTPITDVPEYFLSWWPHRYTQHENPRDTLDCYGILNVATDDGFFSEF